MNPERGQLIPPVYKPASEPKPIHASIWMIGRLLDLPFPFAIAAPPLEIIERRRECLYQEEGAKWVNLFNPGANEDDPTTPAVFKMFDNTDEGIPEKFFENRDNQSALEIYQFRVIAKRFLISQEIDLEERIYLGEVIGMPEDEINYSFLKLYFAHGFTKKESLQEFRNEVFEAYKRSFTGDLIEGNNFDLIVKNYEESVVPLLNELFPN